jgi:glycosyltransferase involved in cell wall biosynthesis
MANLRLALISDLLEERWHSMDLIADMLFAEVSTRHREDVSVEQIRPRFQTIISRLAVGKAAGVARNFDRLLNRHVVYPRFLQKNVSDFKIFHIVDHSYAHLANGLPEGRTIVTCHDLDAFRCVIQPEADPRPQWFRHMSARILKGLQRAAHVMFVSRTVRNEALSLGLVRPDRSSVVSMGVHPSCSAFADERADGEARKLLGTGGWPFLLHVGSTVKRKRLDVLLKVFASVLEQLPEAKLIRVGGPLTPDQRRLAIELGVLDRIAEMPFLERDVLAAIYRRADFVLQPSEMEGFGLPLVEAMACGCPVIASDLEVFREVGGREVTYCRLGDVEEWSDTVVRLAKRVQMQPQIKILRQRELTAYAEQFSWSRTADQAVQVYRTIAKG